MSQCVCKNAFLHSTNIESLPCAWHCPDAGDTAVYVRRTQTEQIKSDTEDIRGIITATGKIKGGKVVGGEVHLGGGDSGQERAYRVMFEQRLDNGAMWIFGGTACAKALQDLFRLRPGTFEEQHEFRRV